VSDRFDPGAFLNVGEEELFVFVLSGLIVPPRVLKLSYLAVN